VTANEFPILLWDIDGTLITHAPAQRDRHAHAVHLVLQVPTKAVPAGIGKTDRQILIEIIEQHTESTDDLISAALNHLDDITDEDLSECPAQSLPGVSEMLTAYREARHLLLTGNTPRRAAAKTRSAGLAHHFDLDASFYGHEYATRFELVASTKLRLTPDQRQRAIIIGDTPLDIQAARSTDLPVIAVATGVVPADLLEEHQPDVLLETLCIEPREFESLIDMVLAAR
jgi:phosphoglycolate phosphatase